ncbi:MAG: penicillin acylase family protein, partial [Pseudomonadota bacterium]
MGQVFKWLFRIAGGMVALTVLTVLVLYFLLSRSLPIYDKDMQVTGITAPVEIVRDNANVPHVFGQTDADSFFGLGYVHAQDRLWQMVMLRRTAQGRLSEIFGTQTVDIDMLMRRLDLYRHARTSVDVQDARTKEALRAYAAGVNARLREINEEARGKGAPEMFIFNPALSPWQPADSIAIVKLMAVTLSGHLEEEVLQARASTLVDEVRLRDIMPLSPGAAVADLPDYSSLFPGLGTRRVASTTGDHALSPFAKRGFAGASNAFAAAPNRSATGGTILANDPHLGFSAPAIWYLARVELATGGVIGGTIPGAPLVMAGRSNALGWGITASYMDDQDVFIEKLNPENPDQYLAPEGFKPFRTENTIIRIEGLDPVTLTLRWTDNGPVLPGTHYNLADVTPPGHVAALSWTALSGSDTSMTAAMALMRARSVEEGLRSGRFFVAPTLNLMLADRETIAMKTIG